MAKVENGVRKAREALGLTTGQLAFKTGLKRASIWQIEKGRQPSLETALVLARALRTRVENLFWIEGASPVEPEVEPLLRLLLESVAGVVRDDAFRQRLAASLVRAVADAQEAENRRQRFRTDEL